MTDVAVIGAGITGLVCAQRLQQAGYRVVVVEKSRGLGGRLATRRLAAGWADHGVRYLDVQGQLSQLLIEAAIEQNVIDRWTDTLHEINETGTVQPQPLHPCYGSPLGITAVAKFLAAGLDIWRGQRVVALTPDRQWTLALESAEPATHEQPSTLTAPRLVVTIPAPQAVQLLEPLADFPADRLAALRSVEFDPCLSAIATYSTEHQPSLAQLPWKAVTVAHDAELAWIALESSKTLHVKSPVEQPIVVVHSTAALAQEYLESPDLQLIGHHLLARAAHLLLPWLRFPETLQVHRWRYAFARRPLPAPYLTTTAPLPIVCGGDWCGGRQIEDALRSGLAAAAQIMALDDAPAEKLHHHRSTADQTTAFSELLRKL